MSKALIINVLYDNSKNPAQMSSGHWDPALFGKRLSPYGRL